MLIRDNQVPIKYSGILIKYFFCSIKFDNQKSWLVPSGLMYSWLHLATFATYPKKMLSKLTLVVGQFKFWNMSTTIQKQTK